MNSRNGDRELKWLCFQYFGDVINESPLKSQAYLVTHTVNVAYEAMHLDETNALWSLTPIYLFSIASYWRKPLVRLEFAGELG